ncbi:MAG: hypothetical protein VB137_16075 [Burkholderia sp.]
MGDRFAALEPISRGVREQFGSVEADAGRGLSLRMDHGSQYRSDDFRAQLKFWGITRSYAFVAGPQTHGVAKRFNRTRSKPSTDGCSTTLKKFVLPPSRSRTDTIANGVSKNWASRHPSKPVRQRSCHLPPDRKSCLNNRIRYTRITPRFALRHCQARIACRRME